MSERKNRKKDRNENQKEEKESSTNQEEKKEIKKPQEEQKKEGKEKKEIKRIRKEENRSLCSFSFIFSFLMISLIIFFLAAFSTRNIDPKLIIRMEGSYVPIFDGINMDKRIYVSNKGPKHGGKKI